MGFLTKVGNWIRGKGYKETIETNNLLSTTQTQPPPIVKKPRQKRQKTVISEATIPVQKQEVIEQPKVILPSTPYLPTQRKLSDTDSELTNPVNIDESRKEIRKSLEKLKQTPSFSTVEQHIDSSNVVGLQILPTSNLDDVSGIYKTLMKSKATMDDPDILAALVAGRDKMTHRFTVTLHIHHDKGSTPIQIKFFGVLAEHTNAIAEEISEGMAIDSPQSSIPMIAGVIFAQMQNQGSGRSMEVDTNSIPHTQITVQGLSVYYDFA